MEIKYYSSLHENVAALNFAPKFTFPKRSHVHVCDTLSKLIYKVYSNAIDKEHKMWHFSAPLYLITRCTFVL